jgi:ferric iron reductase protein FhuF
MRSRHSAAPPTTRPHRRADPSPSRKCLENIETIFSESDHPRSRRERGPIGVTIISADRADAIVQRLAGMGGATKGRFYTAPPSDLEVHAARVYLDPTVLREHAYWTVPTGDRPTVDIRAVVSRFTRGYCMAVIRPVLAALAMGIALDASIEHCRIVWKPWNVRGSSATNPFGLYLDLDAAARPMEGRSIEAVRSDVYRALFAEHLALLFESVLQLTKISHKVLWANASEGVGGLATAAAEELDAAIARPFIDVCEAALTAATLPGIAGANPLRGHIRWEDIGRPDFPHGLMVRRVCCISFTLPDRVPQIWCAACPLPTNEQRIALTGR